MPPKALATPPEGFQSRFKAFLVKLELHPPEQTGVDPQPAETFRIVKPGQGVDLWQPPSTGERPPHS
jgi:hypothetical protein